MPPSDMTAPIQAAISTLTGPDWSGGESVDRNSGNVGDVQPTAQPWPRQQIFAVATIWP